MSATFNWCKDKPRLAVWGKQVFYVDDYGTKWWYLNGKYHRVNGPAIEWNISDKWWYLNGKRYYESDYWNLVKELKK